MPLRERVRRGEDQPASPFDPSRRDVTRHWLGRNLNENVSRGETFFLTTVSRRDTNASMADPRDPNDREPSEARDDRERDAPRRKERVLHTRVPAVLEDELKRLATNLRMPVSNVVRAILEDALEAVEVVGVRAEDELKGLVHRLAEQREAIRKGATAAGRSAARGLDEPSGQPSSESAAGSGSSSTTSSPVVPPASPACPATHPSLEGVLGFQRITLRTELPCTVCGRALRRGSSACRGVRDDAGPSVIVDAACALVPQPE